MLEGLFSLCSRLIDVKIVAADGEAPTWNVDVRFFRVKRRDGTPIVGFYLDPLQPAGK